MRKLWAIVITLCFGVSASASAQLTAPIFGLTGNTSATYASAVSTDITGPAGATICYGINMTPTATTAGTCDTTAGESTYSASIAVPGTVTLNAIATESGQTNSAVATLAITIPTFSYSAGTYAFSPVVAIYPGYNHAKGTICYTTDGSTPTESGNACTHGTTYSGPVTISATSTLNALFTISGQTDKTASAAYTVRAPETWFVRPDGGTYYDANVTTGQCNGLADVAYPGTGTDQNCAVNDVRYLWADNSGNPNVWIIGGGDTVVIRGCTALSSQDNPDNPNCRLGWDNGSSGNPPNSWCGYGNPNSMCFNPPVPSGSAAQPTKILGQCAYGTYTCTPINNDYPYGTTNETQIFGGFGLAWTFNLQNSNYVTIEGIELTEHNGVCTVAGAPSYPAACDTSTTPFSDIAENGFLTNSMTSNLTLQDVYIHGFTSDGLFGPIGGPITMTRVFVGFNGLAGWLFDDGYATQDGPGSSITANYVTMDFNGCYEQYPIKTTYPAQVCYDTNSEGFGDSWSGQGSGSGGQVSELSSFYCNHCVDDYNTKDAFIGPHIAIPNLTIINSVAIGNMGSNWKWGGEDAYPMTLTFDNNLTVNNCYRMNTAIPGTPSTYNQYLTGFCRAGGNGMASVIPTGSTWNITNSTFVSADNIAFYIACSGTDTTCPSTVNTTNDVFLGYTDPSTGGAGQPTLYYFCTYSGTGACTNGDGSLAPNITLNASHNIEYGMKSGTGSCPTTASGILCEDPLLYEEPAQPWPAAGEPALDVFSPFSFPNSFYPTASSPIISAGTTYTGIPSVDYYGTAYTSPPIMGAVEYVTLPTVSSTISGSVVLSGSVVIQ